MIGSYFKKEERTLTCGCQTDEDQSLRVPLAFQALCLKSVALMYTYQEVVCFFAIKDDYNVYFIYHEIHSFHLEF